MIDLPSGRQSYDYDCGVKALQLVLAYYGMEYTEGKLLKALKSDDNGTSINNIVSFAEKHGFQTISRTGWTLDEIKLYVDKKHPVIVLVQAWADKYMTLDDWRASNEHGHYVIFIGYYDNIIVFEDPASFRKTWLTKEEFLVRWHDVDPKTKAPLEHFGLILLGKDPAPIHKGMEHMN
ncbi:MAG: C39 family peptidase [Dehalococcoidales bacterium]|nr:C39 family peptidase [Dehalococcoidales bacterium]